MALDIEKLVKIGGKEWQKGDLHRVYFDGLMDWYGLDLEYYNSGHISSARLNGEPISNSEANRIYGRLAGKKFWYDVADGQYHAQGITAADFEVIRHRIRDAYHAL